MRRLFVVLLHLLFIGAHAQESNEVQFLILDDGQKNIILDKGVSLVLVGNNYGNGPIKEFKDGMVFLKDIPAGSTLRFFIQSSIYYCHDNEMSLNIVNSKLGNNNAKLIYLEKLGSNNLIIRGKVVDKQNESKGVSQCNVEINIEKASRPYALVTDSLGYFFLKIPDGKVLYPSNYTISLHHSEYTSGDFHFFVEKDSINTLRNLPLERKPPSGFQIRVIGPPQYLKNLHISGEGLTVDQAGDGLYILKGYPALLPQKVQITMSGTGWQEMKEVFDKDSAQISAVPIDVRTTARLSRTIVGVLAGVNGMSFMAKPFGSRPLLSTWLGFETYFNAWRHTISAGISFTITPMNAMISNKYATLPGLENELSSEFHLSSQIEFSSNYFLKSPYLLKAAPYAGIVVGVMRQHFSGNGKDSLIREDVENVNHWYTGLKLGCRWNVSGKIMVGAFAQSLFIPFRNIGYAFNYFGRANETKTEVMSVTLGVGAYMVINLFKS